MKNTQHGISLRDCRDFKHKTFTLYRSHKEERKKGAENLFEEIVAENFPTWEGNKHLDSGSPDSSK